MKKELVLLQKKYGYIVKASEDDDLSSYRNPHKALVIVLNGAERIEIILYNQHNGSEDKEGIECFCFDYILWGEHAINKKYNTEFFCELGNTISGKQLEIETVNKFLSEISTDNPENSTTEESCTEHKIHKSKDLNFFGDWLLDFELSNQDEGTLSFSGYIK